MHNLHEYGSQLWGSYFTMRALSGGSARSELPAEYRIAEAGNEILSLTEKYDEGFFSTSVLHYKFFFW